MGTLYVIGTPIGNLDDLSKRVIDTLNTVDYIACEDTRNSINLLRYLNINKKLVAYHKFNEKGKSNSIIEDLKSGMNIGKDIMATTVNTLYFAVISSFIGFFMWHYNTAFGYIINYKSFVQEVFKLLICIIGSILVIPITSYITSRALIKNKE